MSIFIVTIVVWVVTTIALYNAWKMILDYKLGELESQLNDFKHDLVQWENRGWAGDYSGWKIYLITDAMGYVPTAFYVAESEEDAREEWQDANDPHCTDRSYIHTCDEVRPEDVHLYEGVDFACDEWLQQAVCKS